MLKPTQVFLEEETLEWASIEAIKLKISRKEFLRRCIERQRIIVTPGKSSIESHTFDDLAKPLVEVLIGKKESDKIFNKPLTPDQSFKSKEDE